MIDFDKYYQLGEIVKSHGVKGEVSLRLDIEISESELIDLESVFVVTDGIPIPFFIEYFKKHNNRFIVKFEDYNTIDKIEEFIHCKLLIDSVKIPEYDSELKLPDLIRFLVVSNDNKIGVITDYSDVNGNLLFNIENEKEEFLIPANVDFITDVDVDKQIVYMNLPEGILDF